MHVSLFVDFKLPVAGRVYGFVAQFGTAEDWQPVCGLSLQYICLQTGGLNLCRLAAGTLGRKISLIKILIIRQKHKNIVKTPLGKKDQNSLLTVCYIFHFMCRGSNNYGEAFKKEEFSCSQNFIFVHHKICYTF